MRHATAADAPRAKAFVDATREPPLEEARRLALLEEARQTPYEFLRAAAATAAGILLIQEGRMEEAAECYLAAVECGPAAFGFGAAAGGFAERVFPCGVAGTALAPHNLSLFVASFKLSPESATFKRIVAWLRRVGTRSECPAWRAVALFHYGVVLCVAFKREAEALVCWTAVAAIADEALATEPLGVQAKLLSEENLRRRTPLNRGDEGTPSPRLLLESLGGNFHVVHAPPLAGACGHCGLKESGAVRLKTCTQCLNEQYCGKDCQRLAWAAHRGACKPPTRVTVSGR